METPTVTPKPKSGLNKPRKFPTKTSAPMSRIEAQDKAEATEPQGPTPKPMDPVTALLDDRVYVTDYTWPFMCVLGPGGRMRQLCVTRFYMRKNFALDMFVASVPPAEDVKMKSQLLRDHGIKYFCLHAENSLADLTEYMAKEGRGDIS